MEDEPSQMMSVKDRIAKMKLDQVGRVPEQREPIHDQVTNGTTWGRKDPPARPTVPPRPTAHARAQTTNVPTTQNHTPNGGIGNQPEAGRPLANANSNGMDGITRPALPPRNASQASQNPTLPPRKPSNGPSPSLPPRRPSETPSQSDYKLSRRGSNESVSSIATARSSVSGMSSATSQSDRYSVKAPSYDPSALPPLPPKRTEEQKEAYYGMKSASGTGNGRRPLKATLSSPNVAPKQEGTTPPPPRRPSVQPPPALPSRSASGQQQPRQIEPAPRAGLIEPPRPRRSALEMGMNYGTSTRPPLPSTRPGSVPQTDGAPPPPIPTASRPDLSALQATKPKLNGNAPTATAPPNSCLHCRDFSAPDNHAARFPRHSLPSSDLGWLANQLTSPFPSPTDKARAIFTWLHHNVAYDTVAFFNNAVKPSTPQKTLDTGLAVCEGYAGLFAALGMKAGLETYVVSGHGKGFGYSKLKPGEAIPPFKAGHAWNAVKIDDGQWKLIDACWGAGTVGGAGQPYTKRFAPMRFTQSNEDFGMDHFPGDKSKQFRADGRVIQWEEYYLGNKNGCGAFFFSGFVAEEGLSSKSFTPVANPIVLAAQQGPTIRFSFQKICPHWDPVRCGSGAYYIYALHLDSLQGTERDFIPFETNGEVWWCDVPVKDLGHAGQTVALYAGTSFGGRDGRGLKLEEYPAGGNGVGFGGVCKWEIV